VGADADVRGAGHVEGRGHPTGVMRLAALYAFFQEHERCGELDSAVDRDRVWMTCTSSAVINRCCRR
jgi:hypothetical protein